ncbi:MAG: hypothetical protein FWF69_05455 [Firmicutes bacterium]|nr:hypothetical protein [Bacillota bacterium]
MMRIRRKTAFSLLCGGLSLLAVLFTALYVAQKTGANFFAHSAFDSYTLQAMTWREGRIALSQDYPWLELAIFQGRYYVSFPPVPAIPMWLLSFACGADTPSALLTLLYLLGGAAAAFCLLRRYLPVGQAACFAAFTALGGSLLDLAVSGDGFGGGVWYQAQTLAFFLTMLSMLLMDGKRPLGWAVSLVCVALSVGCRPLNALYVPVLLWMLNLHVRQAGIGRSVLKMLPYIVVPALIAAAYGVYNYVRFGNPLEFGHSFLPEYTQSGDAVLSAQNLWANFKAILRPPQVNEGALTFPIITGFAVYLTNPLFLYGGIRALEKAVRKQADSTDALLVATVLLHAACLLTHRTNGGWQYGTRYLCDALPALVLLFSRGRKPLRLWEALPMSALILFNVFGTIVFHSL